MNLLDVIKRPVITEKSMLAMDDKKYTLKWTLAQTKL